MYGELIPLGGGDPIPLLKKNLLVGRRESCDIVLRFANVSAHHCQLTVIGGYWYVRDLNSRNGTKVNGVRVTEKRVDPGDILSIAKHRYELRYSPVDLGAVGPPPPDETETDILSQSLLERAGLVSRKGRPWNIPTPPGSRSQDDEPARYDITKELPSQIPGNLRKSPPPRKPQEEE
jgi:adenylate cyclase